MEISTAKLLSGLAGEPDKASVTAEEDFVEKHLIFFHILVFCENAEYCRQHLLM